MTRNMRNIVLISLLFAGLAPAAPASAAKHGHKNHGMPRKAASGALAPVASGGEPGAPDARNHADVALAAGASPDFDYFYLVRQWPATFCNDHSCTHSPPKQ